MSRFASLVSNGIQELRFSFCQSSATSSTLKLVVLTSSLFLINNNFVQTVLLLRYAFTHIHSCNCLDRFCLTVPLTLSLYRSFVQANYGGLKAANPTLPILVREAKNAQPKITARYSESFVY